MDQEATATLSVVWRVSKPASDAFAAHLQGLLALSAAVADHLGMTVLAKDEGLNTAFHVIARFASTDALSLWQQRGDVRGWVTQARKIGSASAEIRQASGTDAWFVLPSDPVATPPRYKTVLLTLVVLFPLLLTLQSLLLALGSDRLPPALRLLATLCCAMPLMTYALMPRVTRLARHWLFPELRS